MNQLKKYSLSGVGFTFEKEAYSKLYNYLNSLKKAYENNPDCDEILADIEARITELILSATSDAQSVVTLPMIEKIGDIRRGGEASSRSQFAHLAPSISRPRKCQIGWRMRRLGEALRSRYCMDSTRHLLTTHSAHCRSTPSALALDYRRKPFRHFLAHLSNFMVCNTRSKVGTKKIGDGGRAYIGTLNRRPTRHNPRGASQVERSLGSDNFRQIHSNSFQSSARTVALPYHLCNICNVACSGYNHNGNRRVISDGHRKLRGSVRCNKRGGSTFGSLCIADNIGSCNIHSIPGRCAANQ